MWWLVACAPHRPPELRDWRNLEWFPATRWERDDGGHGWTVQVNRQFVVDLTSEAAIEACEAEMRLGAPGCEVRYGCSSISYRPPIIWMFFMVPECDQETRPAVISVQPYRDVQWHTIPVDR
jgi:hypothetical protein